jgi:parallel beta-helix repeat protein
MKSFFYPLLAATLLTLAGTANATPYYVSDCGSGATSSCVAGNDANAGTSPAAPWKSCAKVTERFPGLAAGDQVLFARGSAQNACKLYFLSNLNSRANNRIVLGAYTPAWANSTTAAPILNGALSTYTLSLLNSGNATHDEGYVVQDLHFVGGGLTAQMPAIMMSNDVKYVTIQRVEVEQYPLAIQCGGGTNNPLGAGSDGLTEHIIVRGSNIHHNRGMGILSGCNDTLIENNTFDNNGVGMLDHHIYLTDAAVQSVYRPATQVVVRGNKLTNNSPYASATAVSPTPGTCGAVAIVAHGQINGLVIENNIVAEPTVPASGSCWGISVDSGSYGRKEGFSNVAIRGNTVVNYAMGIGLDLCDSCTVENNYVYSERGGSSGVVAPSKFFSAVVAGNTPNNNLTVRNNTVYMKNPTYGSVGVRVSRDGSNHQVASNLIYFGAGSTAETACFNTSGLAASAFPTFDYNLCFFAATTGKWDTSRGTLATQRAAGLDLHSQAADPNLTTPSGPTFAVSLGVGSPAIKAGHPSSSSKFSHGGLRRDTTSDIGAFQSGATIVVPSSPTSMTVK